MTKTRLRKSQPFHIQQNCEVYVSKREVCAETVACGELYRNVQRITFLGLKTHWNQSDKNSSRGKDQGVGVRGAFEE